MADTVIDLRSDTVTKPSPEMRRAMAEAEVGDDVFLEDPTINRLQDRAAHIFGREAALFVPSGSMGNLTCIIAQTRPGQEIICEEAGHVYNYEMASMSAIAGVLPRIVTGQDGILSWETISKAIRPKIYYRPQTALISLENTHNMAGGTVYPTKLALEICDKAHDLGIPVHLDGARIFNAATYLGEDVAEMTKKFDSVQFCLSKGLGAPVGSLIVGSRVFIERCRSIRKMLGGGMRQAGVLAAAGLVALEKGPRRLQIDHDNAKFLATQLAGIPGITLDPAKVQTNIVIFDLKKSGSSSADFLQALAKRNVLAVPVDNERVRMVAHLDVDRTGIETAANSVREVLKR
ncbi:MAG: low specificity L-threonine aldolase [Acidobacteria bacterium 13_1_20CM_2_57_8]|nr:MAG: low specificity L-threonine aldolase [Acidobacteria bacterium 13_1_40CM_2_56_5]OLE74433.1 MAG: low specificity L-threonine aldolase [Acidobacteria bacterium 13_1_20CM_2_57_8]